MAVTIFSVKEPASPKLKANAWMQDAIERYFQISLYLLILIGFFTLASTGRLDALSVMFVSAALLFRGYLLLKGRNLVIPEPWTSYLTLAYVVFYVADFSLISSSFVAATVHLVLFSMVVKIFSVQRDRDHFYLAILSFLEVLAAAVLTVDTVFFAAFSIFMLLAVTTFISMEMKRSAAAASARAATTMFNPVGQAIGHASGTRLKKMRLSLSATGLVLMVAILAGAAVIFFILPRISAGYLSNYVPRNEFVSGFSDNVRLGEIGAIQQSNAVVMHVQVEGDRGGSFDLRWRGVALGNFDGFRWYNPPQQLEMLRSLDGRFNLARLRARWGALMGEPVGSLHARLVQYRVLMEPIGASVFFLAGSPEVLWSGAREIALDPSGAIYNASRDPISSYTVFSNLQQPNGADLRAAASKQPPEIALRYLQLPRVDPRVRTLAIQLTAASPSPYEKALALELYLKTHFGYTLQLPTSPARDPLANFLFERKEGHCEYFASSLAVMLRAVDIPARIVNGFRTGEFNDLTGSYIIRARDAHSWVEAYFPGQGWVSFDPTPPATRGLPSAWTRIMLYVDATREFWREWIINYDFLHQRTLSTEVSSSGRRFFQNAGHNIHSHYAAILERARRLQRQIQRSPGTWTLWGIWLAAALLLLINARRLWRAWRRRQVAANPERAPSSAASIWYARMIHRLARRGWRKRPAQTPREFVRTIQDPPLQNSVARFTSHYERARFGASPEDAQRLPELYEEIKSL